MRMPGSTYIYMLRIYVEDESVVSTTSFTL